MKIGQLQIERNLQDIKPVKQKNPENSSFKIERNRRLPSFNDVLVTTIKPEREINFSAHAQKRINTRKITIDMERLETGLAQVQKKGSQNSLVLIDNDAFLVNVKNKTVITAVDQQSMKNNVFTNIDSVAIV